MHHRQYCADSIQVRLSPQASAFFFKCCAKEGLPHLDLVKYVRTRWSSMYDLLEHVFMLKAVSPPILYLLLVDKDITHE
jgi:hypothetical protein